ncbi:hypothetical protein QYM36_006205 [Artemia franciscana]|uniref:Uncharacterized protein n=1 Tax=Artemia franciscana TaxID=6661 RepID=A0AA88HUH9_ARTSF|nr:hypothetical protein QYM36_006205 [Artemia franciscana]
MNCGRLGLIVSDSLKWKPREDLDVRREEYGKLTEKEKKKQYYSALFEESKADHKRTWKVINELVSGLRGAQDSRIEIKGMVVEDRQELYDKFGDYFTNTRTTIEVETRNSKAL